MPHTLSTDQSFQIGGLPYRTTDDITSDKEITVSLVIAPAKTGQLTTRTSSSEGELTMEEGHGITSSARLDLYWAGGSRRGITVGTVNELAVPLTTATGSGDDLPDNLTAITAMVPHREEVLVTGNDVVAVAMRSTQAGTIVIAEDDDSEITARRVGSLTNQGQCWLWTTDRGDSPVAASAIAQAFFSHGSASESAEMRLALMFN